MVEYGKLRQMLQSALKQSAEESSMLLGRELTVKDLEVLECDKDAYLAGTEDPVFVVPVDSREDYPGRFHLVFSLRDAILMSGILLGIPPGRISEKRKLLILEEDDIDAFSEIANQVIGTFNSVFQPFLSNKFHLKQLPPAKFVPQVDEVSDDLPLPVGEYMLYKARLLLGDEELNRFDILVPVSLANRIDPPDTVTENAGDDEPEAQDQAASLRRLFPEDGGENSSSGMERGTAEKGNVLILEDDSHDREELESLLNDHGFSVLTAHPSTDISEFFADGAIRAVVLGVKKTEEWELSLCSKIGELSGNPLFPLIICSGQWTRTAVLKALKNGAKDIVLKPYREDELLGKLCKFLEAA